MKIYILKVSSKFQPSSQPFKYPINNKDYGVEQDFLLYLNKHKDLITDNPLEADWHYLPIYWTRWHLNHDYGKFGLDELQKEVNDKIIEDYKTFTICQYSDGPLVNIGKTKLFLSSRRSKIGVDIPCLRSPHRLPRRLPSKKYLASFVGRLSTHDIRKQMAELLKGRRDIFIYNGQKSEKFFVKKMLESYISLAPRGHGGSSFRFYEALELGIVPILISDIDTRPFKRFIEWDKYSIYTKSVDELDYLLKLFDKTELRKIGEQNILFWKNNLRYQKWCKFVIQELSFDI